MQTISSIHKNIATDAGKTIGLEFAELPLFREAGVFKAMDLKEFSAKTQVQNRTAPEREDESSSDWSVSVGYHSRVYRCLWL